MMQQKIPVQNDPSYLQETLSLYARHREVIYVAWNSLRRELVQLDIEKALSLIASPDCAQLDFNEDPYDKSKTLMISWLDGDGAKQGEIQIRSNGSFYAEYDVIRDHPKDVRWFIEAVTAWGDRNSVKSELRLLPAI